ncbi:arsenate reductase [Flectobacillus major]|jgi:arsenate reductase|uniref:arsenate reductase n=1 Tax=Flectobacillus major TaxID=103 RepID=UPI00041022C7|nr:arsenate reductase [Flectobacillus major]
MYKIYGIPNCDTVKKAITWLKDNNIPYEFHNFKKEGITIEKLQEWLEKYPWETLVNKAGTTWKKLEDAQKATDQASAIELMLHQTSVIKRPILESDTVIAVGFKPEIYQSIFQS